MPDRDKTARDIFLAALDVEPLLRAELLNNECGDNVALRKQVDALLQAHDQPDRLLDDSQVNLDALENGSIEAITRQYGTIEQPGARIGPYKPLQPLGEGGFGVVFMAEQREPILRQVAIKIIKPGMDSRQVIARFEAERQALAFWTTPTLPKCLMPGRLHPGAPIS